MPGGGQLPDGVDASAFQNAMKICASLRPSGAADGQGGPGGGGMPEGGAPEGQASGADDGNNAAAYLNCLAEHGASVTAVADLNTADATVAAAVEACAPLKPAS